MRGERRLGIEHIPRRDPESLIRLGPPGRSERAEPRTRRGSGRNLVIDVVSGRLDDVPGTAPNAEEEHGASLTVWTLNGTDRSFRRRVAVQLPDYSSTQVSCRALLDRRLGSYAPE